MVFNLTFLLLGFIS
jgi:hypothetical protein